MSEIKSEKAVDLAVIKSESEIRRMIYIVRNQQVMLDSDLASLYHVETKRLNERVKRNQNRFPDSFCFQLTRDEFENLRSQFATSSEYGGRRYLPYVFTESGIAMLSAVLNTDVAVEVSVRIMNSFVEMRRFIASNAALFERISAVELKQLEYQKQTDEKFDKVSPNWNLPTLHILFKLADIGLFQFLCGYAITKQNIIVVHQDIRQFFN